MRRRSFLAASAAIGVVSALQTASAETRPVKRKGRIKQGLWRTNFGRGTRLGFDDMCRQAARLGAYGFDLIAPQDWPTLRRHGLEPLIVGTGGVDFEHGLIHPEVHDKIEASIRPWIDKCADNGVERIISIGGKRHGMPYDVAADNAVAFLDRIKQQLERRKVTLAIEIMNNRRTDPAFGREDQVFGHWDWGIGVCERVASPNVKLLCDVYHLQIMDGDVTQRIRDTIQWIAHFHVAGVPTRHEIDYTQELNFRYVAEVIADLGYEGYVSHEWRPTPGRDPLQSIAEAMSILDV